MHILLTLGAAGGIIAAATTLAAVRTEHRQQPTRKLSYDVECLGLSSLGKDINALASQGWAVRAMIDHTNPATGQPCVLILFEHTTQ